MDNACKVFLRVSVRNPPVQTSSLVRFTYLVTITQSFIPRHFLSTAQRLGLH
jgi:hypothetical protein